MEKPGKRIFAYGRIPGLLILYVLLQPVLDAVTALSAKSGSTFSAGMVVRALFFVCVGIYLLLSWGYPGRRWVLSALIVITGYFVVFCLWSLGRGGLSICMQNAMGAAKVFYFLYTALLLYVLYRQRGFLVPLWCVAAAGAGYCVVILVAWLTGTSFVSYNAGYGYCGWFYSANDVGNIILFSAPVLLHSCFNWLSKCKKCRWPLLAGMALVLFSLVFSAAFIGTKLVFLGVLAYLAAVLCWFVIRLCRTREKKFVRGLTAAAVLCALLLCLYPVSPLNAYLGDIYVPMSGKDPAAMEQSQSIPGLVEVDRAAKHAEMEKAAEGTWLGELIKSNELVKELDWILSRRLMLAAPILEEYLQGGWDVKLLGLGYGQMAGFERKIGHLVEMDAVMMLLRHGVVGFCVYYLPFLIVAVWAIVSFLRRLKAQMSSLLCCSVAFSALVMLAASTVTGHVLQAPSVSLFTALIYAQWLYLLNRPVSQSEALL